MAETEEQRTQRALEELKGKNVAHYSVMLAAYINARVDANKAIFAFSSTGIGLLIAIANKLQQVNACVKIVYVGALMAFFVAACSTLLVFKSNAEAIESYVMLEQIERDPAVLIDGDDLAVQERTGRQPFTCAGDLRELLREQVPPSRPERDAVFIPAGKAAVTIEFHLVKPFIADRNTLHGKRIHRFDKVDFGRRCGVQPRCSDSRHGRANFRAG
jgi:hypothetical protein